MAIAPELKSTLKATGFVIGENLAPGLIVKAKSTGGFFPDAVWRDRTGVEVLFKFVSSNPQQAQVASWHRDAWNSGIAPLLWIVSPQKIEIYNTFQRPDSDGSAKNHLLGVFEQVESQLAQLDNYAGRLSMVSGQFWTKEKRVDRSGRVDQHLLRDLRDLEFALVNGGLSQIVSQDLIGRTIFTRYLFDRGILTADLLKHFGSKVLNEVLASQTSAYSLFKWIERTFGGDLFPIRRSEERQVKAKHLKSISETLSGVNPISGQGSLWPYKFDVIPIELISSIYEQFAHDGNAVDAYKDGLHYTPVSVVNLVLDEVLRKAKPESKILDVTCGSGVFLVEALRRLVLIKSESKPSRQLIRDTLRTQIFGVDKNESAVQIAAFSLYLTALELDPDPRPPEALRFEPLIGRNLFIADAFQIADDPQTKMLSDKVFDVIVGNPPWTFGGKDSKPVWEGTPPLLPPRSADFAFVWSAIALAHEETRFGIVMRATPFFSSAKASVRARNALFEALSPVTLVNLAALRDDLFPTALYPAVILFSRTNEVRKGSRISLVTVPWTSGFARSGVFEISPSDVRLLDVAEVSQNPYSIKVASLGTPRDRLLLRKLTTELPSFSNLISELSLKSTIGVQLLDGDRNDASQLIGLPLLDAGDLEEHIRISELPKFNKKRIHRPRSRNNFSGPLVIVGEGLKDGRVNFGYSDGDVVYSRSFYGISFFSKKRSRDLALAVAGVLQSSLASWFLLLTSSEFGIHKRKILLQDLERLPVPRSIAESSNSKTVRSIAIAVDELKSKNSNLQLVRKRIDEAVFELYGLGLHERIIVSEGLIKAKREYKAGREEGDLPVNNGMLREYAKSFLDVINAWSSALDKELFDAELFELPSSSSLRIVRFLAGGEGAIKAAAVDQSVNLLIEKISARMRLPIAEQLSAVRELRVHAAGELFVLKPAARRFWSAASGLNDADLALGDGLEVN